MALDGHPLIYRQKTFAFPELVEPKRNWCIGGRTSAPYSTGCTWNEVKDAVEAGTRRADIIEP